MSVNIPQLTIEMEVDGTVLLEQEWCGETDRIQLHPVHIRHLAELSGLLPVRPTAVTAKGGLCCPLPSSDSDLGHEHTGTVHPPCKTQQPATEMSDEELAHAYFAAP